MTQKINGTLDANTIERVLEAIETIREAMPFLVDLSAEERRSLAKMGERSYGFVTQAYLLATRNPDFLPRAFDLEEMQQKMELFQAMQPLVMAINQLHELVDDTYKAIGSETYTAALSVYSYAKAGADGMALSAAVKELSRRFTRSRKENKEDEAMEAEMAGLEAAPEM